MNRRAHPRAKRALVVSIDLERFEEMAPNFGADSPCDQRLFSALASMQVPMLDDFGDVIRRRIRQIGITPVGRMTRARSGGVVCCFSNP